MFPEEGIEMTSKHGLCGVVAMLSATLGMVGCMSTEPGADDVTSTEQAVMSYGYSWGDTSPSFANIGTSANRTCFLSGVTGNLQPELEFNFLVPSAGVRVNSNGDYEIYVQPSGGALGTYVQCLNTAAGRTTEVSWFSGQGAKILGSSWDHPMRRCFLTQISSGFPGGGVGFSSNSDYARVWNDGFNWYLGGVQGGGASATARCVDVSGDYGSWAWIAGDPGARQDLLSNVGGIVCPLTGIGGHFNHNDWSDGVYTSVETAINQFYMNTKNGHTGWTTCVK